MEMSDIFLTLVGLVIAMLGWFLSRHSKQARTKY